LKVRLFTKAAILSRYRVGVNLGIWHLWWPAASGTRDGFAPGLLALANRPCAKPSRVPLPVVRGLQGAGFCLYQTLKLLHWVLPGGAGWPGRGSGLHASSIFQIPQDFQEAMKQGHLYRCLFVGTWLQETGRLNRADRPGQPEPPGSTRCSMPSTSQIPQAWTFLSLVGERT